MDFACVETQIGNGSPDDCETTNVEEFRVSLSV